MKKQPLTMRHADFINKITTAINESNLPPLIIEYVLREALRGVEALSRQQAADDVIKYQEQEEAPDGNG